MSMHTNIEERKDDIGLRNFDHHRLMPAGSTNGDEGSDGEESDGDDDLEMVTSDHSVSDRGISKSRAIALVVTVMGASFLNVRAYLSSSSSSPHHSKTANTSL